MQRLIAAAIALFALTGAGGAYAGEIRAGEFSPTANYELCTADSGDECTPEYYRSSEVQFRVQLAQDDGEEELDHITLKVPAGFGLPKDKQLEDGEKLGDAHIEIAGGPGCAGAEGTQPLSIDGTFRERDRTAKEIKKGFRVVFRLDLSPIPPIDLKVRGNKKKGYRVETEIPKDDPTCPPFKFDATFLPRSEVSDVPVYINPPNAGTYEFVVIFKSVEGSTETVRQSFEIT
jgi:hypothetical protein